MRGPSPVVVEVPTADAPRPSVWRQPVLLGFIVIRAADVVLKERRRLVMALREMPLSDIHLENMLRLTRAGAVVMPAAPGFYHRPTSIEQLVDFIVARVLDHLGIDNSLAPRWGE